MEHFDKYIRKHTQNDLPVPDGLDWENMNFQLPEKKKKDRKVLWFLFLGMMIGGLFIGLLFYPTSSIKENSLSIDTQQEAKDVTVTKKESKKLSNQESSENTTKPTIENSQANSNEFNPFDAKPKQVKKVIDAKNITSSTIKSSKNTSNSFLTSNHGIKNQIDKKVFDVKRINEKTNAEISFNENILSDLIETNKIDTLKLEIMVSEKVKESQLDQLIKTLSKPNQIASLIHFVSIENNRIYNLPIINMVEAKNSVSNKFSMYVASGYNYSMSDYHQGVQAPLMSEAISAGHGYRFTVGSNYYLNNKFFFSSGLTFQKLKTYFKYNEDLGTEYSVQLSSEVHRVRHICHNNETDYAGVKFGIGKDFDFSPRFGGQVNLSILSEYQLRSDGRLINENETVFRMEDFKTFDRLNYSIETGLGIYWRWNQSKIIGNLGWQNSLSKSKIFEHSDLAYSVRVLHLSLGIEHLF